MARGKRPAPIARVTNAKPRQTDAVKKQTVANRKAKTGPGAAQSPTSGPMVTSRKPRSTG